MSSTIPSWDSTPTARGVESCPDPDCAACKVKEAGAREMWATFGHDYDAETPENQAWLRHIANHVYAAMSDSLMEHLPSFRKARLETGETTEVEVAQ